MFLTREEGKNEKLGALLAERGVPTELVIYPEDAHNVPRGPGLVDWLDRTVRWFERWCPPR